MKKLTKITINPNLYIYQWFTFRDISVIPMIYNQPIPPLSLFSNPFGVKG